MSRAVTFLARRLWWRKTLSRSVRVMRTMVLLGVTLSIAALVVTLSVTAGFERDYKKSLLDFNAHVIIYPGEGTPFSEESIRKGLKEANIPDVELLQINPFLYREGLLIHDGVIKGVILKGTSVIPAPYRGTGQAAVGIQNLPKLDSGFRRNDGDGLILGEALAQKLNVTKGETIKLLVPQGKEVSAKNTHRLKVSDTFHSGLYEFDSQFALIDLQQLQDLFHLPHTYYGYELKLNHPELAPAASAALEEKLPPGTSIQNWIELNGPLFQALELEKWVFKILMGLMVFVASLNLIGVILLMIFRKKKAIAMLQALGLASKQIRNLFGMQGFLLGITGVGLGLLSGSLLVWSLKHFQWIAIDPQIYFVDKLPVSLEPWTLFIIAIFGLLLVWQISWLAASRAVSIPIREGLHGPG